MWWPYLVRECVHQARCLPVEAFEEGKKLRRTGFQLQQKRRFFHRSSFSCANYIGHVYLTPTYDVAWSFVSSWALCTVSGMYSVGWDRLWFTSWPQTLSAAVLDRTRRTVKKTNRLTQTVVFFRRHFLCGALLCSCLSAEREDLSAHTCTVVQREYSAEPSMRSILSLRIFTTLPGSRLRFFIAM